PTAFPTCSANQRLPSGPAVIPRGVLSGVGIENSMTASPGGSRPMRLPRSSVNQRAPSGPVVIDSGKLVAVGIGVSVTAPPAVMPIGPLPTGRGNSVTAPAGVTRAIRFPDSSVNQSPPSGPGAIPNGWLPGVGTTTSEKRAPLVIRPIRLLDSSVNQRLPSG